MRDSLRGRLLLAVGLLAPTVTGCKMMQPTPVIPIVVRDAETKQPIPDAQIRLWSPADKSANAPEPAGTTGPDGLAHIKAAYPKEADVLIDVSAAEYLPDQVDKAFAEKMAGAPAGGAIVELFKGPRPLIQLVVPSEFRGDLKVEVVTRDDLENPQRARVFTAKVPPTGVRVAGGSESAPVVHVEGPAIFHEEGRLRPEIRGYYPDMTPMPADPKDKDIVLRWVRSAGPDQYFVVGTKVDQLAAQKAAEKNIGPREKAKSANGGGGGRPGGGGMGMGGPGGMGGPAGMGGMSGMSGSR